MAIQNSGDEGTQPADDTRTRLQARLGDGVRILDVLRADSSEYLVRASAPPRGEEVLLRLILADRGVDSALHSEAYRRFEQRAESLARLDHPNIVAAGPLQQLGHTTFYAVRDARAKTLEHVLAHDEHLSLNESVEILRDVASALDHASSQGIVHGQLDPSVIVLGTNGIARVADFAAGGDASVSHSGRWPAYRAPELWQHGATADARADIYALGVIAFEMLSGRRRAISMSANGIAIVDALPLVHDMLIRPGVGLHVNAALLRAVSKRPAARFATAGEFVAMLEGKSLEPLHGLPTQRPNLEVDHSSPFAFVPMILVVALGIALGVLGARRIPQSVLQKGDLGSIMERLHLRSDGSMPSGYTSTVTTESSKPMLGSPSTGGNGSPSGPIFPGAATAAGPQGQAGRTTLVGPRTTASSGTAAPPSAGAAPSGTSPVSTPTSGAPDGAQAQPADSGTLGYIRVEYDGPRTLVMIDELPRGRTPFVGRASPGAHSVRLIGSKARFPIQQVRVAIGDTALASFSELAPAP